MDDTEDTRTERFRRAEISCVAGGDKNWWSFKKGEPMTGWITGRQILQHPMLDVRRSAMPGQRNLSFADKEVQKMGYYRLKEMGYRQRASIKYCANDYVLLLESSFIFPSQDFNPHHP